MNQNIELNGSKKKSILVFTMHRSGSMFLYHFCAQLSGLAAMTYYSPNLQNNYIPDEPEASFWKEKSGCFGPLRWYMEVPHMDQYNIILNLRDPRDVLVSMFYSYCYSHAGAVEANTGIRKEVADRGIDDFVLTISSGRPAISGYGTGPTDLAGNVLKRYEDYVSNLIGKPNVTFVKYEEMVTDFQSWLAKMTGPFNLPPNPKTNEKEINDLFCVSQEDKFKHKRKIVPGDYKDKLKPQTIAQLNDRFKTILENLEYQISE